MGSEVNVALMARNGAACISYLLSQEWVALRKFYIRFQRIMDSSPMRNFLYPLLALGLFGADWPQFRGPNGSGLCASCGQLPTEFGPKKNVLWKTDLPPGKSSPVLAGDRIFLTASEGDELITLCLDRANGKVLWRRSVRASRREVRNALNQGAAPTAVTDGKSVFAFFADFGLIAYDFQGKQRWQLPLGPFNSQHGVASSPVYADGKVILVCDQDTDAYIVAVDADSGKIAWKTPREVINGYATPIVYRPTTGPMQVIAPGSYQLTAYSVVDGKTLWFVRGLTCQPKSPPTIVGDVLYFNGWTVGNDDGQQVDLPTFAEAIAAADANHDGKFSQAELPTPWQPTGTWRAIDLDRDGLLNEREWNFYRTRRASRNGLLAIKLGGSGDVTDTHVLWRFEKLLPDVPAPLVYKNVVYLFRSGGIATTLSAQTGKVLKQARLTGALEGYYSSPVGAGGKVYIASEHGKVVVLRAAGDWEVLGINEFDSDIYATPAIGEGKMYIRTKNALYAIGSSK
jgi:outer membrane protein assembly factor BamB